MAPRTTLRPLFLFGITKMSGAPPGYNPSDSLLSGGTTPITGVMGGGGASNSLLTGGESVVIQGVKGGGKAKRALSYRRKRKVQRGGAEQEELNAAILKAVETLDPKAFEKAIKGADVAIVDTAVKQKKDGKSLLHLIIENKSTETEKITKLINLLVSNGVNINEDDETGARPILYAIDSGNAAIVQTLINAGADLNNQGTIKDTLNPLSYACGKGDGTIARMLLKAGADLKAINFDGRSTLDVCRTKSDVLKEDFAVIKKMVSTFNDVSAKIDTYTCLEEPKVSPDQYLSIGNLDALYESYASRKKLPWIEPIKKDVIPSSVSAPSVIGPYKPPLKRLITIIPSTTKNLVVFPPIYGDIIMMQKMLIKCEKMKLMHRRLGNALTIEEDTVFVFMPPFYTSYIKADTVKTLASNKRLFTAFLSLEANNINKVFVLAEHTNDNVIGGKFLNPIVKDAPVEEIPTLLEPSYILYPYGRGPKSGILLSAKGEPTEISLPARICTTLTENDVRIKDLFNHHTSDAIHVRIDPKVQQDDAAKTATLAEIQDEKDGFNLDTLIRYESTNEVKVLPAAAVPTDDTCKGFIDSNDMNDTTFEKGKVTSIGPCTDVSGNKVPYFKMIRLIIADVADAARPYCQMAAHAVIQINLDGNRFIASDEAKIFEQSANFVRVSLEHGEETRNYILRDPSEADTARHWDQLIFTDDESAFLNDLNFSPDILKNGCGADWKTELVGWMKTYVLKKCFEPVNLLTDSECVGLNVFMKKMYDYFESPAGQEAVYGLAEKRRKEDEDKRKRDEESDPIEKPMKDDMGADIIKDIKKDGSREFTSQKITWNMINPIEVADEGDNKEGKGPNTYSLGLLMVKHLNGHPEQYRFGSVKVKANSTDEARSLIKTKIVDLRKTYPLWSFIY